MSELKRAAEAPDFVVDEELGALLNTNSKGLQAYRTQRDVARQQVATQSRLDRLEETIDELKLLLLKALNQ